MPVPAVVGTTARVGGKLFFERGAVVHPERNLAYRAFRRLVPATDGYRGTRLVVREGGRLLATPLFLVLVTIEATDVVFAVDSVPAVFAVTDDPFIVYTSNIFAILGLRALFFLLSGALGRLRYLRPGLAAVLVFVGVKMLIAEWWHVPIGVSLGVIAGILAGAIAVSVARPAPTSSPPAPEPPPPEA